MNLNEKAREIAEISASKGFLAPVSLDDVTMILSKLMLVTTEVSEAAEAARTGDYRNFCEELADIIIRVLHLCAAIGVDIEYEIDHKVEINRNRPFKHGRKA